ncbi:hypothetical protein NC651_002803 [Populus alba x Populus x berolinensis]|nr:hypothetical protein NC651_002803 [Populus alba x Populus x berolinensis]
MHKPYEKSSTPAANKACFRILDNAAQFPFQKNTQHSSSKQTPLHRKNKAWDWESILTFILGETLRIGGVIFNLLVKGKREKGRKGKGESDPGNAKNRGAKVEESAFTYTPGDMKGLAKPRKLRGPREKGQNPRPRNRVDARGEEASAGDPLGRPSSVGKLLITFSTRLE